MKLWLDDLRVAPEGWMWAKTVEDAKLALKKNTVEVASLDHDLGGDQYHDKDKDGQNGMSLINWLEYNVMAGKQNYWPKFVIIHSVNPHAAAQMYGVAARYTSAIRQPYTGMELGVSR